MRLLNTATYLLQEFPEGNIPRYAILSHRWEIGEVEFKDIGQPDTHLKTAWPKIKGCCQQGLKDGFKWVWIDSCCIDKSSSAELSEAINSMFSWYQNAQICYAYLSDVHELQWSMGRTTVENWERISHEILYSKWFTRGWTLQELLAPKVLVFYNRSWEMLGNKIDLASVVHKASGIQSLDNWEEASVAQKLSWAAKRETTRVEDRAYSLLGLFGISMPPIYGEGEKAFLKLQLEIIKQSNDETIFAWRDDGAQATGLLARSPDAFARSGNIKSFDYQYDRPAFVMTNKGLRFKSYLWKEPVRGGELDEEKELFALQCVENGARLAVRLKYIQGDVYARVHSNSLVFLDQEQADYFSNQENTEVAEKFHVKQSPASDLQGPYMFVTKTRLGDMQQLSPLIPVSCYVTKPVRGCWSWSRWDKCEVMLRTCVLPVAGMNAAIMFQEVGLFGEIPAGKDRFVFVMEIFKHQIKHAVFSPPPTYHGKDLEAVMEVWKHDTKAWGFDRWEKVWPSVATLHSGASVKVGINTIDKDLHQYEIKIDIQPVGVNMDDEVAGITLSSPTLSIVLHLDNQHLDVDLE